LIPALDGWVLCVDEEGEDCTISVKLPDWVDKDKLTALLHPLGLLIIFLEPLTSATSPLRPRRQPGEA